MGTVLITITENKTEKKMWTVSGLFSMGKYGKIQKFIQPPQAKNI